MTNLNILKNTLIRQRDDKKRLLDKPFSHRALFDHALSQMKDESIKVITGPRRAGKSTFAIHLVKDFNNFIYINFDDQDLIDIKSHEILNQAIDEVYGKEVRVIFVDEIQNLCKFELWLNSLQRRGFNVVATGSNANLLSGELTTHLTGRYVEIEILPFSYKEYGGDFDIFYEKGGFPDVLLNNYEKSLYIETLQEAIVFKDIVQRYSIRHFDKVQALLNYLVSNTASLFSYKHISDMVNVKSENTIRKYLSYLKNSYLHIELLPFSLKVKKFYRSQKKSYVIDNAFIKNYSTYDNVSKYLENFVCTELIKKGYKPDKNLFYFKSKNNYEVDFIVKNHMEIIAGVQVAYNLENIETKNREVRALVDLYKELGVKKLYIITKEYTDDIFVDGVKIEVLPVKKFLEIFC